MPKKRKRAKCTDFDRSEMPGSLPRAAPPADEKSSVIVQDAPFSLQSYCRELEIAARMKQWETLSTDRMNATIRLLECQTALPNLVQHASHTASISFSFPDSENYDNSAFDARIERDRCQRSIEGAQSLLKSSLSILTELAPKLQNDWMDVVSSEMGATLAPELCAIVVGYVHDPTID